MDTSHEEDKSEEQEKVENKQDRLAFRIQNGSDRLDCIASSIGMVDF